MGFLSSISGRLTILIASGAALGQIPHPIHVASSILRNPSLATLIHSFPDLLTGQRLCMYKFFCLSFNFSLSTTAIRFIIARFISTFINIKIYLNKNNNY